MPRSFTVSLRMVLTDPGFAVSVLFTLILCSSAVVYYGTDYNEYTAFTSLLYFSREEMLTDISFSSAEVLRKCGTGWLNLFLPIASAFAWARVFSVKRDSGFIRFEVVRKKRLSYNISEYLCGFLSAGLVCLLAFWLYAAAVYLLYPDIRLYDAAEFNALTERNAVIYGTEVPMQFSGVLLSLSARMFAYGCFVSAPVLALAGIARSPYTMLCLPFFLIYAFNQMQDLIMHSAVLSKYASALYAVRSGMLLNPGLPLKKVLIPRLLMTAVSFVMFSAVLNHRRKRGDCI